VCISKGKSIMKDFIKLTIHVIYLHNDKSNAFYALNKYFDYHSELNKFVV